MAITRRALMGMGAVAVLSAVAGGSVKALAAPVPGLRPPVVLDGGGFAARCLRCYRCIEACPTQALRPAALEEGLLAWKTPVFDFHRGACDFCNRCVEVCPTKAIALADPLDPASGRIGVAQVQPDRCIAYEHGCVACVEACPYDAITADESGVPVVDEQKCNGCGVCENICPALVYRSFSGGSRRGIVVISDAAMEGKVS